MPEVAEPEVAPSRYEEAESKESFEAGFLVICWDDPINSMPYVTHVFQVVFGWAKGKAQHHMMQVHTTGKSILARESMERAEHYVHQLQKYSLHATMEKDR